ncbi:hypothetical protein L7F22_033031 [Adiantum nelumboides]|nr:hypothetical protein [Adiantum nelumboides]
MLWPGRAGQDGYWRPAGHCQGDWPSTGTWGQHVQCQGAPKRGRVPAGCPYKTLDEMILKADGFAGVFPEHKFEIVKRLQALGHLTAMTGDGANDAPALSRANVGVAVEGATDAARGAADIVLVEPGLSDYRRGHSRLADHLPAHEKLQHLRLLHHDPCRPRIRRDGLRLEV